MNLQMIDHIEKILSSSPEYDLQLLRQAGFITEAGLPNLTIINLEVALFVRPFVDRLHTHGLNLSEVHHAFQHLFNNSRYMEVYLLLLYTMDALDFRLPNCFMLLPSSPSALIHYLQDFMADITDIIDTK